MSTNRTLEADHRRKRFIEEYIGNGGNATIAALAVGFSPRTAKQQGSRLLQHPEVQSELERRRQVLTERHELGTDQVLKRLSQIVHADPRKFFHEDGTPKRVHELDDEAAMMVASYDIDAISVGQGKARKVIGHNVRLKLWDKLGAIQAAMKHLGLFEKDNEQAGAAVGRAAAEALDWKAIRARVEAKRKARQRADSDR